MAVGGIMNVAVIGLGYWGPNLLRTFNTLGVLRAAFDLDKSRLAKYEKMYKDVYFSDNYKDKGVPIDAVAIATPPDTHYKLVKEALLSDKHVFVEKPLTLDPKEAEELNTLSKERGLVLVVGHIFLYSSEILKLKEIIQSKDFGEIQYIYLKRLNLGKIQEPANVIEDLVPHDISILDFLLERRCTEVQAVAKSHVLSTEDVAFINIKYEDVLCNLHLSWLDPFKIRDTVVVGTKQMVVCDSVNKRIHLYNKGVDLDEIEEGMSTYAGHLLSYRYGDEVIPYIKNSEPLLDECKDFIDSISNKTKPISDGDIGVKVVRVLDAIQYSVKNNNEWVKL